MNAQEIYEQLESFYDFLKDKEIKIDDSVLTVSLQSKEEVLEKSLVMTLSDFNHVMFSIEVTHFNSFEFKKQVKHPFAWDGDARERFEESEFNNFLFDKNIYEPFQLKINSLNKTYLFNDRNEDDSDNKYIDNLLYSIDLDELFYKMNTAQYEVINKQKLNIKL